MKKKYKKKSLKSKNLKFNKQKLKINNLKEKNPYLIFLRYFILLLLMFSLPIIYYIFTPLTINTFFNILKLIFSDIKLLNDIIMINQTTFIKIIPACVAGSAYLLLLILNLSISMNYVKRILSILFSFILLFIINITRLVIFSYILVLKPGIFDITHKLFWYLLSTLFVIIIWFLTTKLFKLNNIPIYSDLKPLFKMATKKK